MSLKEARSKELSKAFSEKGMLLAKDLSRRNKTSVKAMVAKAVQKRMLKLRSSLGSGLH